ncbi:DUF952 domain-containing protein [Actinocorallia populi]|uniref:DUF952 domain-containing protein n=1 Tax=Actinocorallia populi TaxID=2079200 RepID=UPI000D095567|nr:DUF952 domain-containing protein [Actinocorallia populi]
MSHIFHITTRAAWDSVTETTPYAMSTLDKTLAEEGFIHCSATQDQVARVLSRHYQGVPGLLLLTIDPRRLDVRFEPAPDSPDELYPHLYGPLPKSAVIEVRPLPDNR